MADEPKTPAPAPPAPAAAAPQGFVRVVDPYGDPGLVPEAQVAELLASGGRLEAPEETAARQEISQYGTLTEAAKHVAERGASGLTMGLSDVAAGEVGGDEYRTARERRERLFPVAGFLAEAGGAIAPILASAGTGAAAEGVRLAGAAPRATAALGRLAESGAGAALRGVGLTGESIAGRAFLRGTQLAAGGSVEGALYGAGHALSEAALAPGGDYDHLAERVWAGAKGGALFGGLTGGAVGALGGTLGAVGKRLVRGASAKTISAESAVQALDPSKRASRELVQTKRLHSVGQELLDQDIVKAFRSDEDMLARASAVRGEKGDEIGALLKMADDTGARPDATKLFSEVDEVIGARGGVLSGKHRQVADQLSVEVSPLREAAEKGTLTFEQLHRARRAFDESINWAKQEQSAAHQDLIKIRRIIEGELERSAEKALPGAFQKPYQAAKSAYGAARWAEKQLSDNLARGQANRMFGLTDTITGSGGLMAGALTGSLGVGALTGMAATLGHRVVRTYGHGVVATLLNNVMRGERRMDQAVTRYFRAAGDARRGLIGGASAEIAESDRTAKALRQRAAETRLQAYQRRMKDLVKYQADPVHYMEQRLGHAAAKMPQTAQALAAHVARGNQYLLVNAPGLPDDRLLMPGRKPEPDPVSLEQFARREQVVNDPMSVLDELERGTLAPEHVEALEATAPKLYMDIKSRLIDEMAESAERGKPLPYLERVELGALFGMATDASLLPDHIVATQASMMMPPAPPQPARRGGGGGKGGPAQRMATRMDALETGAMEI